jgi:hypothetical protein
MTSKLNPRSARKHLQSFRFADLFIEDLGWNHPESRKLVLQRELTWEQGRWNELLLRKVADKLPADAWDLLKNDPDRYIYEPVRRGAGADEEEWEKSLPPDIAVGLQSRSVGVPPTSKNTNVAVTPTLLERRSGNIIWVPGRNPPRFQGKLLAEEPLRPPPRGTQFVTRIGMST